MINTGSGLWLCYCNGVISSAPETDRHELHQFQEAEHSCEEYERCGNDLGNEMQNAVFNIVLKKVRRNFFPDASDYEDEMRGG